MKYAYPLVRVKETYYFGGQYTTFHSWEVGLFALATLCELIYNAYVMKARIINQISATVLVREELDFEVNSTLTLIFSLSNVSQFFVKRFSFVQKLGGIMKVYENFADFHGGFTSRSTFQSGFIRLIMTIAVEREIAILKCIFSKNARRNYAWFRTKKT